MFRVLGSIDALNKRMNLRLTHHDVNWVYNLHRLAGQGYYLKSRYPEVRLIQCLPTSNKNLKEDFLIFTGEWHDGLPCPTVEGKPGGRLVIDLYYLAREHISFTFIMFVSHSFNFRINGFADRRYTKPNLRLVNKESLDRLLKAEIYVNEANGQLRVAHLILGYTPLSFAFQAPKCVIRARDPRLHRISVAYEGFIVPEGIPLPQYTSRTEPLSVASVSAGTFPPLPSLRKKGTKRGRKKEKGEDIVVTVSESSDELGISGQPIRTEEDSDEMGIQRKPQKSLLELMEGQPGKSIPAKTISPQASSLPAGSPPPAPRHPPRSTPQPVLPNTVEPKRRRGQKDEEAADTSKSRPTREEDDQRAAK